MLWKRLATISFDILPIFQWAVKWRKNANFRFSFFLYPQIFFFLHFIHLAFKRQWELSKIFFSSFQTPEVFFSLNYFLKTKWRTISWEALSANVEKKSERKKWSFSFSQKKRYRTENNEEEIPIYSTYFLTQLSVRSSLLSKLDVPMKKNRSFIQNMINSWNYNYFKSFSSSLSWFQFPR